jgi:hypothetical protein
MVSTARAVEYCFTAWRQLIISRLVVLREAMDWIGMQTPDQHRAGLAQRHVTSIYHTSLWNGTCATLGVHVTGNPPHPTGAANEGAERAEATITVTEMASRSAYYQTLDTSIAREDLAWRRTLYMRLNHLGDNSSSMAPDDLAQALTCQRIDLQTDLVAAG